MGEYHNIIVYITEGFLLVIFGKDDLLHSLEHTGIEILNKQVAGKLFDQGEVEVKTISKSSPCNRSAIVGVGHFRNRATPVI